jgi:hypothetical protein
MQAIAFRRSRPFFLDDDAGRSQVKAGKIRGPAAGMHRQVGIPAMAIRCKLRAAQMPDTDFAYPTVSVDLSYGPG